MRRRPLFAILALLALGLFFGALAVPAIGTCPRSGENVPNWFHNDTILFFGWMAVLLGQWGWLANIPFLVNVVTLIRGRRPGRVTTGIQGFFLTVAVVTLQPGWGMRLPHNEAWDEPVCWLGAGFWMWVAAQLLVCAAALLALWLLPRPPEAERAS